MLNKHCLKCDKPMNGGVYRKPDVCPHCFSSQKAMLLVVQAKESVQMLKPQQGPKKKPVATKLKKNDFSERKLALVAELEAQKNRVAQTSKVHAKKHIDESPKSKTTPVIDNSLQKHSRTPESKHTKQSEQAAKQSTLSDVLDTIAETKKTQLSGYSGYLVEEITDYSGQSDIDDASNSHEPPALKPANRIEKSARKSAETAVKIKNSSELGKSQAPKIDDELFVVKDKADSLENRIEKAKAFTTPESDRKASEATSAAVGKPIMKQWMRETMNDKQNQMPNSIISSRLQRNAEELDKLRKEYDFELEIPATSKGHVSEDLPLES